MAPLGMNFFSSGFSMLRVVDPEAKVSAGYSGDYDPHKGANLILVSKGTDQDHTDKSRFQSGFL